MYVLNFQFAYNIKLYKWGRTHGFNGSEKLSGEIEAVEEQLLLKVHKTQLKNKKNKENIFYF